MSRPTPGATAASPRSAPRPASTDPGAASSRRIAQLASRQHGVATRDQLRALGLGEGAIDRRVGGGLLFPRHRGVYAVGRPDLPERGIWLAAVLAQLNGWRPLRVTWHDLTRRRARTVDRIRRLLAQPLLEPAP